VRVYRATGGRAALAAETEDEPAAAEQPRDYDVPHYVRLLRETFAARLARAFTPDDFAVVFGDPEQPSLFAPSIESVHPVLTSLMESSGL